MSPRARPSRSDQPSQTRHRASLIGLWSRLGVRARVTVLFGLGALFLSVLMGCLSYFTVRQFLVSDQENAVRHQAFANASLVARTGLSTSSNQARDCSKALKTVTGSNSVLYCDRQWFATLIGGKDSLPGPLRTLVLSGSPAIQTTSSGGTPAAAVGVPIPAVHVDYFEVVSLADLAHTLRVLALALAAAGFVTTVLGAAVGRSASARSLRPLSAVSRAAVAIAGGRLDTRLHALPDDPDLAGLTSSFNTMVDQLQERIEREARFSSDVSHELRSPLTTLAASLDVLESNASQLSPRARHALDLLAADLRRFQRMVDELLEISRFDTGSADVFLEEVDPGELVRRAVAARAGAQSDGAAAPQVNVAAAVEGVRITVDKRRFGRVMANLLENATLYAGGATAVSVDMAPAASARSRTSTGTGSRTGTGTGTGTAARTRLDTGSPPQRVQVAVEDRGPGIAPAERARIFERFYRGQASGRRGVGTGTGLGLALVAEHVQLLGGRVWVESAASGGARFVVELPVAEVPT